MLYTEPEVVKAGTEVAVFYNPRDTPLAGKPRIFLQGGWNRWSHVRKFGPIEMTAPAEGGLHFKVEGGEEGGGATCESSGGRSRLGSRGEGACSLKCSTHCI